MPQASSGSQPSSAPYKPVPLTIDIGGYTRLNGFVGQRQAARTWCWAAVASSIAGWYALRYHDFPTDPGGQTEPPRSQCEFVRKFLHRKACKLDRLDGDCSKNGCAIQDGQDIGFVNLALDDPMNDHLNQVIAFATPYAILRKEVTAGRPVAIRVNRTNLAPHLVIVIGFSDAVPGLLIWDPARGETRLSYNGVTRHFGAWTHTVLTEPKKTCLLVA